MTTASWTGLLSFSAIAARRAERQGKKEYDTLKKCKPRAIQAPFIRVYPSTDSNTSVLTFEPRAIILFYSLLIFVRTPPGRIYTPRIMFRQIIRLSYALSSSAGQCHGVDSLINNIPLSVRVALLFMSLQILTPRHAPSSHNGRKRKSCLKVSRLGKSSTRIGSIDLTRGPLYSAREESRVNGREYLPMVPNPMLAMPMALSHCRVIQYRVEQRF